jgi:hypothetical protein
MALKEGRRRRAGNLFCRGLSHRLHSMVRAEDRAIESSLKGRRKPMPDEASKDANPGV